MADSPSSLTTSSLLLTLDNFIHVSDESIKDRSKSDHVAKVIVFMQIFWFLASLVQRYMADLPVSNLKIKVVGNIVCGLFAYALWWKKPRGVGMTTLVESTTIEELADNCFPSKVTAGFRHCTSKRRLVFCPQEEVPQATVWGCHNGGIEAARKHLSWETLSIEGNIPAVVVFVSKPPPRSDGTSDLSNLKARLKGALFLYQPEEEPSDSDDKSSFNEEFDRQSYDSVSLTERQHSSSDFAENSTTCGDQPLVFTMVRLESDGSHTESPNLSGGRCSERTITPCSSLIEKHFCSRADHEFGCNQFTCNLRGFIAHNLSWSLFFISVVAVLLAYSFSSNNGMQPTYIEFLVSKWSGLFWLISTLVALAASFTLPLSRRDWRHAMKPHTLRGFVLKSVLRAWLFLMFLARLTLLVEQIIRLRRANVMFFMTPDLRWMDYVPHI